MTSPYNNNMKVRSFSIKFLRGISTLVALFFVTTGLSQGEDFKNLPVINWKVHISQPFLSSPVISENLVYIGGLDSILYAVDLSNGKIKWRLSTGGEIRSNVLIDNNNLFLAGGDGVFYALDKTTGRVIWKRVFNKNAQILGERKYDIADYYTCSPVMDNNTLFFGSGDGRVNAVEAKNGELLWSYQTNDIIHATPVLYNRKLFVGSFDGNLYALNSTNGQLIWKFKSVGHEYFPKGEMQGNLLAFNGVVYAAGRDYNLYAINAETGYCQWNQKYQRGWALANAVKDSLLYVGTSEDKFIAAINPADGKELWRTDVRFNIFGAPAFTQTMLYVGTLAGKVFGIDCKTGAIQWTFYTDGYKQNHDKFFNVNETLRDEVFKFIKNNVDYINAQLKWGAVFSSPAVSGNSLVISSTDGTLYCLKNNKG